MFVGDCRRFRYSSMYKEIIAFMILIALPIFFWSRGIIRNHTKDMLAGILFLIIVSSVLMWIIKVSIPTIGFLFFSFGVATLIAGALAKKDSVLKRQNCNAIGIFFIILGFCTSLIM